MRTGAALFALMLIAQQGSTPQRFTSGVELITVDVLVTDGRKPISGLTASDFEIRDNDVVQQIRQLEISQLPLDVVLALDVSKSVEGVRFRHLREAAASIIKRLRPEDKVALATFSHQLRLLAPLTSDRGRVARVLADVTTGGETALRDAAFASVALRGGESSRALVLLFTDGMDTASFLDERHVLEAVRRSDVIMYPVAVRLRVAEPFGRPITASTVEDEEFLRALANESGGRLMVAEGDRDIGRAFARVLDEFNGRYVLAYTPSGVGKGGWHRVGVRLTSRKGTVTARRGYFAR
jgi:VWFA-related protein